MGENGSPQGKSGHYKEVEARQTEQQYAYQWTIKKEMDKQELANKEGSYQWVTF